MFMSLFISCLYWTINFLENESTVFIDCIAVMSVLSLFSCWKPNFHQWDNKELNRNSITSAMRFLFFSQGSLVLSLAYMCFHTTFMQMTTLFPSHPTVQWREQYLPSLSLHISSSPSLQSDHCTPFPLYNAATPSFWQIDIWTFSLKV